MLLPLTKVIGVLGVCIILHFYI